MKNFTVKIGLWIILANNIFLFGCAYEIKSNDFVSKQKNEIRQVNKDTSVANNENYDYELGEKLADSILSGCSIFTGSIQEIRPISDNVNKNSKQEIEKKIIFFIENWLRGERVFSENIIELDYYLSLNRKNPQENSVWQNVKVDVGKQLLIAYCPDKNVAKKYGLVTSEEKYFQSIKEVIDYQARYENDKNILLEVPQILNTKDDFIFAGYINTYIWRMGTIGDVDNFALVLASLLGSKTVPSNEWRIVGSNLQYLIVGNALKAATRDEIANKLVELGSSEGESEVELAIGLLVHLSSKDNFDLNKFLSNQQRLGLKQNYQKLIIKEVSQEERVEFERQLQGKKVKREKL